ncbi:MAG: THUMP domain-containing protein [Thermodesulfobacteriota bacterium]
MNETTTAAPSPALDWNLVVTSRVGGHRQLRGALKGLVRLRPSGFRNVLVGRVDDVERLLTAVAELRERSPRLDEWLGKIVPIERTFAVDPARFEDDLEAVAASLADRLAGQSFHVRLERRGHKGEIDTHASEQALGKRLSEILQARGEPGRVTFDDPDVVVAIEVVGDAAGLGLIPRAMRTRWPFVKID